MTKKSTWRLVLLLNLSLLVFSSCSNDDDDKPTKPTINLTEVGSENSKKGVVGSDLHLEGSILAEGLIKRIDIEIHQENGGTFKIEKSYTDGKYIGVRNADFHEHIDIPANTPAGSYHLHFTVTDQSGQTTVAESEITIEAATLNITIEGFTFGSGHDFSNNKIGYIDTAPVVEATSIKADNGIARIFVEIHSEDGTPSFELDTTYTYANETELTNFHKHIIIPNNAPAGDYHLHLTVYDKNGSSLAKSMDIQIKETGLTISALEIGNNKTALASSIKTKFNTTAVNPFKSIRVRIYKANATTTYYLNETYTEDFTSGTVKAYTFNKDLVATGAAAGEYILEIRINDNQGAYKVTREKLTITGA